MIAACLSSMNNHSKTEHSSHLARSLLAVQVIHMHEYIQTGCIVLNSNRKSSPEPGVQMPKSGKTPPGILPNSVQERAQAGDQEIQIMKSTFIAKGDWRILLALHLEEPLAMISTLI